MEGSRGYEWGDGFGGGDACLRLLGGAFLEVCLVPASRVL